MSTMRVATVAATLGLLRAGTVSGAIVYHDPPDITAMSPGPGISEEALLDLDRDGVPDFRIGAFLGSATTVLVRGVWVEPVRPGGAYIGEDLEAWRFDAGQAIGDPGQPRSSDEGFFYGDRRFFHLQWGQWSWGEVHFAGVQFERAGAPHVAWLRVQIDEVGPNLLPGVTVLDFAWEDQPGVPIAAGAVPAPGSLAAMALWAGLAAGRGRRVSGECRP